MTESEGQGGGRERGPGDRDREKARTGEPGPERRGKRPRKEREEPRRVIAAWIVIALRRCGNGLVAQKWRWSPEGEEKMALWLEKM